MVLLPEGLVRLFAHPLLARYERPGTFPGYIPGLFFQPIVPLRDLSHDHIRTVLQKRDFSRALVTNDDSHPLGLGREWEHVQNVEAKMVAGWGLEFDQRAVAENQRKTTDSVYYTIATSSGDDAWQVTVPSSFDTDVAYIQEWLKPNYTKIREKPTL